MTDEEMAEQYANENKIIFEYQGMSDFVWQELKEACLAGLNAGRPKWHKVADGDLPKEKKEYWCKVFYYKSVEITYSSLKTRYKTPYGWCLEDVEPIEPFDYVKHQGAVIWVKDVENV